MSDHRIVCTSCDSAVVATLSYDGYGARCDCTRHALQIGSGDLPSAWEQISGVTSPTNFKVWCEGHIRRGDVVESPSVECCSSSCDGGNVTVEVSEVDVYGYSRKVTFACDGDHGIRDRDSVDVAYYRRQSSKFEAVKAYAGGDDD